MSGLLRKHGNRGMFWVQFCSRKLCCWQGIPVLFGDFAETGCHSPEPPLISWVKRRLSMAALIHFSWWGRPRQSLGRRGFIRSRHEHLRHVLERKGTDAPFAHTGNGNIPSRWWSIISVMMKYWLSDRPPMIKPGVSNLLQSVFTVLNHRGA